MNRINKLCNLIMNPNEKYLTNPEYELACKLACWLEINMESKTSKKIETQISDIRVEGDVYFFKQLTLDYKDNSKGSFLERSFFYKEDFKKFKEFIKKATLNKDKMRWE